VRSDESQLSLHPFGESVGLIDAAKDAITAFIQKVFALYQTVDDVVASNKGTLGMKYSMYYE
jgi:hypothetical protein